MEKPSVVMASPLFVYILKCLLGLSAAYALYLYFPEHQFYWTIITVLLVIAPDAADANRLALDRIKANGVGAVIGASIALLHTPNLLLIGAGVALTILVCWSFKLAAVTRSALAALVIVMINKNRYDPWHAGLERMGCVLAGCVIGLVITFLFHARPNKAGRTVRVPGNATEE